MNKNGNTEKNLKKLLNGNYLIYTEYKKYLKAFFHLWLPLKNAHGLEYTQAWTQLCVCV